MRYEYKYRKLVNLQKKCMDNHLFVPPIVSIGYEVKDRNNIGTIKSGKEFSKSYVRNFYNWAVSQLAGAHSYAGGGGYGAGKLTLKSTAGDVVYSSDYLTCIYGKGDYIAAAEVATYGIVVGSADTAESFDSYFLGTQIAHGTGAGQLYYNAQEAAIYTYDSENKKAKVRHSRLFENNSGGSITIKEVAFCHKYYKPSAVNYMTIRDLLQTPVVLSDGQSVRFYYEISFTYPE
jgi:hypothetical protein